MDKNTQPLIMLIDDEPHVLSVIGDILSKEGYRILPCEKAAEGLKLLETATPDLILLDILMPEMDGYQFCGKLQEGKSLAFVPVIFLTALTADQNRAKAFSLGAADYLTKPFQKEELLASVKKHLTTRKRWRDFEGETDIKGRKDFPLQFRQFQEFLSDKLRLPVDKKEKLSQVKAFEISSLCKLLGIPSSELAQYLAEFSKLTYCSYINPEKIQLGKLPAPFCRKNGIVVLKSDSGRDTFVVSNPFNLELFDLLKSQFKEEPFDLVIADQKAVDFLLKDSEEAVPQKNYFGQPDSDLEKFPAIQIADNIVHTAFMERASDIHIEPKEFHVAVRFRIDGEMKDAYALKKETGVQLISRFKVMGSMDIAQRRKPQDGAMEISLEGKTFKLRLATTSTPSGESMIIRLLDADIKPKSLKELGTTEAQMKQLIDFASRDRGFVLVVGPTGSGKTTTIYSLLAQVDCKTRSLSSVEDPVEYRIPFANQQQVNEKAGVTFETVLKSAMRQDPDVLFLGEVRDAFSAKASMDFASTGHLTITTLHTSNATTAVFRLERLGVSRSSMADTILGVVAQRLLKKLCEHCKKTAPPTEKEIEMMKPFTDRIPDQVANPAGCPKCNETGYYGREAIYEIIQFDTNIAQMIRAGKSIAEIRDFIRQRKDYLISDHAIDKVRELRFSPKDIYEKVLVEEVLAPTKTEGAANSLLRGSVVTEAIAETASSVLKPTRNDDKDNSILVVEDNKDNLALISLYLRNAGYDLTTAEDGIEALIHLGKKQFDLIVSDVDMPNLDGFKLLEMVNQKGITSPIVFVTARTEEADEVKGFELGAVDYIKKPIKKEILLMRVKRALGGHGSEQEASNVKKGAA